MNSESHHHWGLRHSDDDGETLHLRNLGPQRTYGTCSFGEGTLMYSSRTSPLSRRSRECLTHTVNNNETLAGIALKYDLTVEDLRRTNGLWTNDNVWPGQKLKVPITEPSSIGRASSGSCEDRSASTIPTSNSFSVDKVPTPTEFLNKLDSSIEESKKATKSLRNSKSSGQISC